MEIVTRAAELRKADKEERVVEFVASTNAVDSHGTVLPVDKWDLKRFNSNGVIGYQHNLTYTDNPDNVIGSGEAYVDDDKLIVKVKFETEDVNPKAEKVYKKILAGTLKAVSVGFKPTATGHYGNESRGEDPNVYYYAGQELLEVSIVNIPSNPEALKRGLELEKLVEEAVSKAFEQREHKEEMKEESKEKPAINIEFERALLIADTLID